jgi:hypothetical protein
MRDMQNAIRVEVEREDDGRWLAEVPALALRILAERLEHGEPTPELDGVFEAA